MKSSSNANVSKASLLYEVRSELECPICREYFTEPKQLLCGHTFCNKCLIRVSNENVDHFPMRWVSNFEMNSATFQCPQCRQSHRGRIQDIGTNYILKDMVEKLKDAQESDEEPEPCSKCAKLTSITELFLCNTCPTNSAQPQPKYCSLCTIQQHNGHILKPYQEIVMQKGLDDMQIKAQLLNQSFQNNKEKIQTTIEIVNQALNSMKEQDKMVFEFYAKPMTDSCSAHRDALIEEFDEMTVPIYDSFISRPINDNLQYYTIEVKDNLEREFTRNQLLNARMEKYSKALKTFLEKFMNFDDYAKKFLQLDAIQFDNLEHEKVAFDEIRQPRTERALGFGDHPYFYLPTRQVARRGRGGQFNRRPPARDYSPHLFDLESDSDNDEEIASVELTVGPNISRFSPLQFQTTGPRTPPPPFFGVNDQSRNGNESVSHESSFGGRGRHVNSGGFGPRSGGGGFGNGNRHRRASFGRFTDNNVSSAGRGGGRGGGFGGGRVYRAGGNNNTQMGGCQKCHSASTGTQCRCNTASRGGRGGNPGGAILFFPAPLHGPTGITISSNNNATTFPPPVDPSGRGRGGGSFLASISAGRGRGGSQQSADNSSKASIVAQNGSIIGNSNPGSSAHVNTTSTTASRFGRRGGFRGRSTGGGWGANDTCSDMSMESIRDL